MTRRLVSEFRCLNCGRIVPVDPSFSAVHNRNHCPYCLWSRCLDLYRPGDRLSACKQPMRPIGLSLKRSPKRYPARWGGELLLVHQCVACAKISLNRLAADDLTEGLFTIYQASWQLANQALSQVASREVHLLQASDLEVVRARLFGWN